MRLKYYNFTIRLMVSVVLLLSYSNPTTYATQCPETGRNTRLQNECLCGVNPHPTIDKCEKGHYCDASKNTLARCSSRPFDKCTHTNGEKENLEDCKCDNKYGNFKIEDCTAVRGRFCNSDNTYGCSLSKPYAKKVTSNSATPAPSAGSLRTLEHLVCSSNSPCSLCQGKCSTDEECRGTLQCYKTKSSDNPIPGCETEGMRYWYGYCYCNSDSPCEVSEPSSSVNGPSVWDDSWVSPLFIAVVFCAVLQISLCIKNRNRWKANLVPYSGVHSQPLQLGISAPDAYAWLSRWAANSPKWVVPSGCKVGDSGQTRGQGFQVGAQFKTSYTKKWTGYRSYNHHRQRAYTTYTTTTWDVLEVDQNQSLVKFRSRTVTKTSGVFQFGNPGRGYLDATFHFQNTPNGCVLVITSTDYSDTNADFIWWKDLLLIGWLIPPCICIMLLLTFGFRCWCPRDDSKNSPQRKIEQANKSVGLRISLALQSTVQNNSNNNMQQQQLLAQQQMIPMPIAHEVVQIQQPVTSLPGSMRMGSVVAVAPQQQTFHVRIPNGSMPRQLLTVQAPNGQQMQISVPVNGVPGQMLQVPYGGTQPSLMTTSGAAVYPMDMVR
jgi:hypothetical protein